MGIENIVGKNVMPITGYHGPHSNPDFQGNKDIPDYVTDECIKRIADMGINLIVYANIDYATDVDTARKYMDLCHKYNIGTFVTDSSITDHKGEDDYNVKQAERSLEKYRTHPAYRGLYIVDEPDTPYYLIGGGHRMLQDYKNLAHIMQYDLNQDCYLNLLPVDNYDRDKDNYERYVKEFCDTYKPKVLTWDYYVYDTYATKQAYFWNMDLIRKYAKDNQIPFWAFIQAGCQWNGLWKRFDSAPYFPNESEFNWNVNTCLAFGAQGIQYFPLIQPVHFAFAESTEWDFERNGILGAQNNKTRWYYYAQSINKQIAEIDEVLMNAVHEGVIVCGDKAIEDTRLVDCIISEGTYREIQSVEGEVMIGCFDYQGKTALYVVNYSTEFEQQVKLDFNTVCAIEMIQNAKHTYSHTGEIIIEMAAGEGVLLVLNK